MLYDHRVKFKGKWYMAGEEVPENEKISKIEKIKVTEVPTFTKTDINRMSVSDLRKTCKGVGMKSADSMTGAEMKACLIDYYNL